MGDTILVAKTGFGKSIIFHAYSVLTGRITIQLIPLSKLGEEQLESIRRYPGTKPCLVTANTKFQDPGLLSNIQAGVYTHILLGPEQATAPEFRKILQDPSFQRQVGLVAIDECHVLSQWKEFRSEYVMIHELRRSLLSETVFFGCSATLDAKAENAVKEFGGFQEEGTGVGQLEIIRTSVDRPDISICVFPILKRKMSSYEQLYFLLNQAVLPSPATSLQNPDGGRAVEDSAAPVSVSASKDSQAVTPPPPVVSAQYSNGGRAFEDFTAPVLASASKDSQAVTPPVLASASKDSQNVKPTPQQIPKTIVFVDGRTKVAAVANYLKRCLLEKGYTAQLAHQTVSVYTSNVPKYDQDRLYSMFCSEQSSIRIVVATTALGMGMDIPDVDMVVQWNIPLTNDIGDLWQRFGRAARGQGRRGIAVFFAPYWAFNCLGYGDKEQTTTSTQTANRSGQTQRKFGSKRRNMLSCDRRESRLREFISQDSSDQSDSDTSLLYQSFQSDGAVESESCEQLPGDDDARNREKRRTKSNIPHWTQREMANRKLLDIGWKNMINNDCHREYPLRFLQEDKCDSKTPSAASEDCCNGTRCNPSLLKDDVTAVPTAPVIVRRPTATSRGGVALRRLIEWCRDRADELIELDKQFARMPSTYFLPGRFQWAIANTFNDKQYKTAADFPIQNLENLRKLVPPEQWKFAEWEERLLEFLRLNVDSIIAEWSDGVKKRRKSDNKQLQSASSVNQTARSSNEDLTLEERRARIVEKQTQQDNETALLASLHRRRLQQRYNKSATTSNAAVINQPGILAQAVQPAQEYEEPKTPGSSKQPTTPRSPRGRKRAATPSFDYSNEIGNRLALALAERIGINNRLALALAGRSGNSDWSPPVERIGINDRLASAGRIGNSNQSPPVERIGINDRLASAGRIGNSNQSPSAERIGINDRLASALGERSGNGDRSPSAGRIGKSNQSPLEERIGKSDQSPLAGKSENSDQSPLAGRIGNRKLLRDYKAPRRDGRPERQRSLTPRARESGLWKT
jgi:superfamily II DNA helicase RecQ